MRRSSLASPIWVYSGIVLIITVMCLTLALPDERLSEQTPITGAIVIIVLLLFNGLASRGKNSLTRSMAQRLLVISGENKADENALERVQEKVIHSSWVLFLGIVPALVLLIYKLVR